MDLQPDERLREAVRDHYAAAARRSLEVLSSDCCGGSGCCGEGDAPQDPMTTGHYDDDTPFGDALAASLGCGNPTALADLRPGEDVLDLGSGGGLDVLLSARRVGPDGTAYGLDMTPEMLALAERNRAEAGVGNARFLQGAIEAVPLPDSSVDVVISNCVINLSTDKDAVLRESFRVLRPGGRFAVSDIVLLRDIPDGLRGVVALWTGCVSGSLRDDEFVDRLAAAGFDQATVEVTRTIGRDQLQSWAIDPGVLPADLTVSEAVAALEGAFASAFVRAVKPVIGSPPSDR